MRFPLDIGWLYAVFLLSVRLAPVLMLTPVIATANVPGVVRGLLGLSLAALMAYGLEIQLMVPTNGWVLAGQALTELFIGALLGFGVQSAFGALAFAGRLLDTQIGFGLSSVINPMTKQSSSTIGLSFEVLAVAYVYAVSGHHMLLQVMGFLLESLPVGQPVSLMLAERAVGQFGVVFLLALSLAAPLLISLFAIDVGVALMSRSMPQFNAFVMAMPVKVSVGLALLVVMLPRLGSFFERWLASILDYLVAFGG
ncbi:flagellar biosynthetic protein FliR [Aquitalea aquatica]|uniref:Flagellar biosynthetic protein FliR n=1 Tax=Aquitalea aquatica TaxID=3044273 RepID=A0A838XXF0_9NEIS|nr:flagellar biosynthetic protein FliR [Aquitalea magnusonii]MBA4707086.1 flagellar biosynthetic protein FliR [Aquitalea magnusonii]